MSQCRGPADNLARHFRFCGKTYPEIGEFGLDVELEREDGELETGYLPFLGALPEAAGPKVSLCMSGGAHDLCSLCLREQDIVRIPTNQEKCSAYDASSASRFTESQYFKLPVRHGLIVNLVPPFPTDATHIDLTWNLQFSAITAGQVRVLTSFIGSTAPGFKPNSTERDTIIDHDFWEQTGRCVPSRQMRLTDKQPYESL